MEPNRGDVQGSDREFVLSRFMRESDYNSLVDEGQVIQNIYGAIQMWNKAQHHHRLWEYAMAQAVLKKVFGNRKGLKISDHGCGAGYLGPVMYWLGHHVYLYEVWCFGNEEPFMMDQMKKVGECRKHLGGSYEMRHRPLCELIEEDKGIDAAFCISTLEHIGEYQRAFRDMCRTVNPGGVLFLTTDAAEDEQDHYQYANLRAGKMFNKDTYQELQKIGEDEGFELLGGKAEWNWSEENRKINDYGFGSLAMKRVR